MNSDRDERNARTYRVTGINLRSKPSGEADRMMTILTKEAGLIRVIAPSARKQKSSLSGRSSLFVVNDLLIARGKSMDKITQAESIESFPKLALDIRKLTASQYLAELALQQAQSDQSQEGLFYLLLEHLHRLQAAAPEEILARLTHAIYQLLAIAGVAPQMYRCCLSGEILEPEVGNPVWRAAFSVEAGGAVTLAALAAWRSEQQGEISEDDREIESGAVTRVAERAVRLYGNRPASRPTQLGAIQMTLMQQLSGKELPYLDPETLPQGMNPDMAWRSIERLLRSCAHYHFDRPIRSATLVDQLF